MSYIIENITTKEVTTKFGPKPAYTVVANGERYSYGFKKPTFGIGDEVDFQYTEGTYGKSVDLTSVRLIKKGTGSPVAAPTAGGGAPAKGGYTPVAKVFPIPPLHGDRAIVRQNSITNATKAVYDFMHHSDTGDVIPDTLDEYADMIIQTARKFEAYSCGDIDQAVAESMTE
jgi:hypothetical protein